MLADKKGRSHLGACAVFASWLPGHHGLWEGLREGHIQEGMLTGAPHVASPGGVDSLMRWGQGRDLTPVHSKHP